MADLLLMSELHALEKRVKKIEETVNRLEVLLVEVKEAVTKKTEISEIPRKFY